MDTHITTTDGTSTLCGLAIETLELGEYRSAVYAPIASDCPACADALKAAITAESDIQAFKRLGAGGIMRDLARGVQNDVSAGVNAAKRIDWNDLSAGVSAAVNAGCQRLASPEYWKARALVAAVIAAVAAYHSVPSVLDAITIDCAGATSGRCLEVSDERVIPATAATWANMNAKWIVGFTLAYFCLIVFAGPPLWRLFKRHRILRAGVIAFCAAYITMPYALDWLLEPQVRAALPSDTREEVVDTLGDGLRMVLALGYFCLIVFAAPRAWRLLQSLVKTAV